MLVLLIRSEVRDSIHAETRLSHLTLPDTDLIRHGKAHQGQKQDESHQQQQHHHAVPPKERDYPDPHKTHHEPKDHKKTADYSREAEMIVQEERKAKNNMPQYKGLERYRILEKMGESVAPTSSCLIGVALISSPS